MRILVFGKSGQLSSELALLSREDLETQIIHIDKGKANLEYPEQCSEVIYLKKPDVIINAAAYTNVEKAEQEEDIANKVNGESPKAMAQAAETIDSPLIHLSTDYVFDGVHNKPQLVNSKTNPLNAYGRSKLLGEEAIRNSNCIYVILRTSWVFSVHGRNFVKSILKAAENSQEIEVVNDQIGGPTSARQLAKACINIAHKLVKDYSLKGTYHYSGTPDISWSNFARSILENNDKIEVKEIKTSEYNSKVKRPLNSRLDCSVLERNFGIKRPLWNDDLKIVLSELENKK